MRDMQEATFVAATIALAACGMTLPGSADDASTTNGGDASVVTEAGTPNDDGGDAGSAPSNGGDGGLGDACTRAIHEPFAQLDALWTKTENGGSVAHEPAGGTGGSGALRAEVTAGGSSTSAQVTREIPGPLPKSIRLAFAVNIAAASNHYVELGCTLQLRGDDDGTFVSFQPEVSGGDLRFDSTKKQDGSNISTGSAASIGALSTGHWYRFVVTVDTVAATGPHVTAAVDGTPQYDRSVTFSAPPELIRVKCGVDHGQAGAAATVFVDDVTLDLCP